MKDESPMSSGNDSNGAGWLGRAMFRAAAAEEPDAAALERTLAAMGGGAASTVASAAAPVGGTLVTKWVIGGGACVLIAAAWLAGRGPTGATAPVAVPAAPHAEARAEVIAVAPPAVELPPAPVADPVPVLAAPPRAPAIAPRGAPTKKAAGTFALELAAIDGARGTLESGDPRGCLAQLDAYERAFPKGQFRQEATLVRVEALVRTGDRPAARVLADALLTHDPASPYAKRIRTLLETPSNP